MLSDKVFEPQFEPKNKHIQGLIAAAGHCGLGQQLLSYGIVSNCHLGSRFSSMQGLFLISLISGLATEGALRQNGG